MKLNDDFVAKYADETPPWGPVGEITFLRTYSRDGEQWYETVRRVVEGCYTWQEKHCSTENRPWNSAKAQHSAEQMYDLMFNMKFLPPGRGLRNMGCDVLAKTGAAANNCGFVSTADLASDLSDPFCWAMDMLMLGVGVGFDTLGAGTPVERPRQETGILRFSVPDTREGWVQALRKLVDSYTYERDYNYVQFDYSQVRPAGSPIAGFGGVASGPEPLREMLEAVRVLLDAVCNTENNCGVMTSAVINDIMALVGRCVVSGGVRRSAEIAFFETTDTEGQRLKNKELYPDECDNYRWAANHSVACVAGSTDYEQVLSNTQGVAELGVFWRENAQKYGRMGRRPDFKDRAATGCNPCAEQTLEHKELCCLVEVFPSRIESYYEFQRVLKYAYLYAKTVTLIPIHDQETQEIVDRNRRIGCSLTGIQQAIAQKGNAEFYRWCSRGYKFLRQLDERYSEWFDVAFSIKLTSVKPSGTVSKLPGVFSGVHFPVSEYYFQWIRFASSSPYLGPLRRAGYHCVDLAPNEPNTTAVKFPVSEQHFTRSESEVSPWEQAEHAAKMQHYWADNQVSITVKYDLEKRSELAPLLRMYEDRLKAISFFPRSAASTFRCPPWEASTKYSVTKYADSLLPVDFSGSITHETDDEFCSGETCLIPKK